MKEFKDLCEETDTMSKPERTKEVLEEEIKELEIKITELKKDLRDINEFKIGDFVNIKNSYYCYTHYDSWVLNYAPEFAVNFAYSFAPDVDYGYIVVAKGKHLATEEVLYLIKNVNDGVCFVFDKNGLELVQ